jgi:hypothetical protein
MGKKVALSIIFILFVFTGCVPSTVWRSTPTVQNAENEYYEGGINFSFRFVLVSPTERARTLKLTGIRHAIFTMDALGAALCLKALSLRI